VKHYGGEITFCEPTLKSREETLKTIILKTGATIIHPYDNFNVISGQGTAVIEFLEEVPGMKALFVPVGGGGLLSGSSISAKSLQPGIKVYGCEPANADDAYRSIKSGILQPSIHPDTIADGLLTALSEMTFSIISNNVDDIFTVSEESIVYAMQMIWQRMKIIVEPSSAVPLAALIENRTNFKGQHVGIILSGGNADLTNLPFRST
jgi:threonine dehydratase